MTYKKELINSIEPNFIFSKEPLNRFQTSELNKESDCLDKINLINALKKSLNSIENCNLKMRSKKLIFGDGNIDSPIMIVGEAPASEEEKTGKTFQGESGILLEKMLLAINLKKLTFTVAMQSILDLQRTENQRPMKLEDTLLFKKTYLNYKPKNYNFIWKHGNGGCYILE